MYLLIKKHWSWLLALVFFLVFFFGIAPWTYDNYLVPNQPHMILDESVVSKNPWIPYEPVEKTGLDPSEGIIWIPQCDIPAAYAQYIHYPENWDEGNYLHPTNKNTVKWWYIGAGVLFTALVVRFTYLYRRGQLKPIERVVERIKGAVNENDS